MSETFNESLARLADAMREFGRALEDEILPRMRKTTEVFNKIHKAQEHRARLTALRAKRRGHNR